MPYLDNIDPSLDYDAQDMALQQQMARITALRGMKVPTLPGPEASFTSAVTRTPIVGPTPKMGLGGFVGQFSPAIAGYTADQMTNEALRSKSDMDARQQQDYQRLVDQRPKGLGPTPALDAQGNPTSQMLPPVPPSLDANLKWAGQVSRLPKYRALADKFAEDQLIEQNKRDQAQQLKVLELLSHSAEQERALKNAIRVAEIRSAPKEADRPYTLGSTGYFLTKDPTAPGGWAQHGSPIDKPDNHNFTNIGPDPNNPNSDLYVDLRNPTKSPVSGPSKLDRLPVDMGTKFVTNNATLHQLDEAAKVLGTPEGRNALGPTRGALVKVGGPYGEWVLNNWIDRKGTVTRAMVTDIGSMKLHMLSGATVTPAEEGRLRPFIPSIGDDYKTALGKMFSMRQEIQKMQLEYQSYAQQQRYRQPGEVPQAPVQPNTPTADPNQIPGGTAAPAAPAAPAASQPVRRTWNQRLQRFE